MTRLEVSGPALNISVRNERERLANVVPELEDLGYSTLWLSGGGIDGLDDVRQTVRAGRRITVGTGILPVVAYDPASAKELYRELDSSDPGRFVLGVGGAHGPRPIPTLNAFLDDLAGSVPAERLALAALGPRMLELARDRTSAAYPFLVDPGYVAKAREILGAGTSLIVGLLVALDPDLDRARELARESISFMASLPPYAASFRRQGYTDDDIARSSDRLIDGITAVGDPDRVAERVQELHQAGADQVVLSVNGTDDALPAWRTLARRLIP